MGKKQHSKDRLFITASEWKAEWGGYKGDAGDAPESVLPFYCCALSFQPFETAFCTDDGYVFDFATILEFINKYGKHPYTGKPLAVSNLTRLHWAKNEEGIFQCPVRCQEFTNASRIVAIKTSGNVYAYETVQELNLKTKDFSDLLTGQPFAKTDVIVLRDPSTDPAKFKRQFSLQRMAKLRNAADTELAAQKSADSSTLELASKKLRRGKRKRAHAAMKQEETSESSAVTKSESDSSAAKQSAADKSASMADGNTAVCHKAKRTKTIASIYGSADDANSSAVASDSALKNAYSSGRMAASMTSTSMATVRSDELTLMNPLTVAKLKWKVVKQLSTKREGLCLVSLRTTLGTLSVRLFCERRPMTCDNFLRHCRNGYYNGVLFHRVIAGFMAQTGDPNGDGTGGKSAFAEFKDDEYYPHFPDELGSGLSHDRRGLLSMANSGANTNGSQFFITFGATKFLDAKHSIFGEVADGFKVLDAIEKLPTDKSNDRPLNAVHIVAATVLKDPFSQPLLESEKRRDKEQKEAERRKQEADKISVWDTFSTVSSATASSSGRVGKYLPKVASSLAKKTKKKKLPFSSFKTVRKGSQTTKSFKALAIPKPTGSKKTEHKKLKTDTYVD